jgi:hypothetical protein
LSRCRTHGVPDTIHVSGRFRLARKNPLPVHIETFAGLKDLEAIKDVKTIDSEN